MTINYCCNFEAPSLALMEFVAKGELAEPVHIESNCGYDLTSGFGRALLADDLHWVHQLTGKLFQNVLDHAINKITPSLPDEALYIVARAYRRRPFGDDNTDGLMDELRVMILDGCVSAYAPFCLHARPVGHFVCV